MRGDVTGVAMARKRRARSARGKGRRRSREKASGLERARGRAQDGDEVDDGATILQLASGLRSRSASQGKRAKAAATGAVCGREERWFGRTAEADAELAVGEWVGAGERPRARRRRGRRRGRDSSTRSWARDAEGVAVREGVDSRHGGGLRARGALAQAYGEKPTPGSQMPSGRRGREAARPTATRSAAEPRFRRLAFGLGAEEGHGARGRGQLS